MIWFVRLKLSRVGFPDDALSVLPADLLWIKRFRRVAVMWKVLTATSVWSLARMGVTGINSG